MSKTVLGLLWVTGTLALILTKGIWIGGAIAYLLTVLAVIAGGFIKWNSRYLCIGFLNTTLVPFVLAFVYLEAKPIPESIVQKVHQGYEMEQVREILGPPSSVIEFEGRVTDWIYRSMWTEQILRVLFDKDNKVADLEYDGY